MNPFQSYLILDSNICIYRTLNLIEPKIIDKKLPKAIKLINDHTNKPTEGKIILTKTVINEVSQTKDEAYILFKEVQRFGIKKLHWRKNDYRMKKMENTAIKSLNKFIAKYSYQIEFKNLVFTYKKLKDIEIFYLKFPEKLKTITKQKLKNFRDKKAKINKLKQRKNNLPEKNDMKILCECIEIGSNTSNSICFLTNDKDFTIFTEEIKSEYNIFVNNFLNL